MTSHSTEPPILYRVSFALLFATVGVLYPYYVMFFKSVGLDYGQIGLLLATQGLVTLIFSQVWGYLADIVLGKRVVLLLGTFLSAAFFIGLNFAALFWHFFILLFFQQIFASPRAHVLNSLLLQHPGGKRRFGLVRSYGSLGFICVNLITGKLAAAWNLTVIFPLYTLVSMALFLAILRLPADELPRLAPDTPPPGFIFVQKLLVLNPCILFLLLVVFLNQSAHSVGVVYISFMIEANGGDPAMVGLFFSYAAMLEVPVFFVLDRVIAVVGEIRLLGIAILTQAARWVLTYFSDSLNDFFLIQTLHCVTFGVFYLAAASYINRKAPEELKASAQTLLAMVYFGLSVISGQVMGGFLVKVHGLRNLYIFTTCLALAAFLVWIKLAVTDSRSQAERLR